MHQHLRKFTEARILRGYFQLNISLQMKLKIAVWSELHCSSKSILKFELEFELQI